MSRNHATLARLDEMETSEFRSIPLYQIELLLEELATMKADAKRYEAQISCEMSRRFSDQAQAERRLQCKDTGTVRLACGDHVIVADLPKEVTWDQDKLAQVVDGISAWDGECASDYVNIKYGVDERKFTAWPPSLQATFVYARTVKTGKATYKIESKKEAA